jgi:hypothetical protein
MGDVRISVDVEISDVTKETEAVDILKRILKSDSHVIDYDIQEVEILSGDVLSAVDEELGEDA